MDAPVGKVAKEILKSPSLTEKLMRMLFSRKEENKDQEVLEVNGKKVRIVRFNEFADDFQDDK